MSYIFLSFSHADADVVQILITAFEQVDLKVRTPASLSPGDSLHEAPGTLIEQASCVVVLWSAAAAASLWVQHEVQTAIQAWSTDRLILVVLDNTELPLGVRDLVTFDLSTDRENQIRRIVDRAKSVILKQRFSRHNHNVARDEDRRYAEEESLERQREEKERRCEEEMRLRYATMVPSKRWSILRIIMVSIFVLGGATYWGVREGLLNLPTEISHAPPSAGPSLPGGTANVPTPSPAPPLIIRQLAPTYLWLGAIIGGAMLLSIGLIILVRRRRGQKAILPHEDSASTVRAGTHHVFVSYSQRDIKFVHEIVQHIEEAGFSVWIDQEVGGHGGQRYAAPIVRAIESSQLVALMCSHNAFTSDHVVREVYVAGDYKKPFIAFLLDQTTFPAEFLYFLSGFPRIPARNLALEQLRSEIRRHIYKYSPPTPAPFHTRPGSG